MTEIESNVMRYIIAHFKKGAACVLTQRKVLTSSDMRKGRGANTNPFWGRVEVESVYSGGVMGTDYSQSVANTATRMGNDTAREDVNLRRSNHHPIDNGELGEWFSTDKRTETKVYLKLQRNNKQIGFKVAKTFFVDGHVATDAEFAELQKWLVDDVQSQSTTQTELGIDKEHEQMFKIFTLSTIKSIKQGENEFSPSEVLREEYAYAVA